MNTNNLSLAHNTYELLQVRASLEGCSPAAIIERAINREVGIAPPAQPPKASEMVAYPLTLPASLHKQLKQQAFSHNVSMAHICRQGLIKELG